ncbi:MAG TPA: hypothetical protein VLT47_07160, partial [Anaeromyxobacteraceae bacterium]|nr:hypothetical protein [Anaeromyxobacteraceae bacterium]
MTAPAPVAAAPAPQRRSRGILFAAIVFGLGGIAIGVAAGRGMLAAPLARLAELAAAPGAKPPAPPA